VIRIREGMYARPAPRSGHGIERTLVQLFADPRTQGFTPGRRKAALRDMQDTPLVFEARQLPQGERLIVATNRPGLQALDEIGSDPEAQKPSRSGQ
jgi:hypothetical protein